MTTIFWAGDSTVQYNDILTFPQTGIGQVMNLFLKPEVRVENHAKNGRSTKSFIDESRLTPIYDKIDRKSTRLNSSHMPKSRMPSSA